MSGRQGGGRNKVLLPPINFIFKLLQQHSTVQIWLFEQLGMRIEGKIRGFDEFMNLVIDDAVEVKQSTKHDPNPQDGENGGRRELGMYTGGRCYLREVGRKLMICYRPDSVEGRQCCAYPGA
jgi:small nuclear ribonucleoprotein E